MKNFSFVKNFKVFVTISIICAAAGILGIVLPLFGVNLFNLDIDFAGGTTMYFDMGDEKVNTDTISKIRTALKDSTGIEASSVQETGDGTEVIVKATTLETDQREAFVTKMKETFTLTDDNVLNVENVNPAVGKDLQKAAFQAAGIAAILMLLYITIRFDFVSGVSAVICLIHDVFVMISVFVIFQLPMNLNFIAAALIIFGYSINASIVTFDRIRENLKYNKREEIGEVTDRSIKQTMTRTVNTTLTTLFTIVMIYILGVPSLQNFSFPIIVGILAGAYSSMFIAGPLWAKLKVATTKKRA